MDATILADQSPSLWDSASSNALSDSVSVGSDQFSNREGDSVAAAAVAATVNRSADETYSAVKVARNASHVVGQAGPGTSKYDVRAEWEKETE